MAFTNISSINRAKAALSRGDFDDAIKIIEAAIEHRGENRFFSFDSDLRDFLKKTKEKKADELWRKGVKLNSSVSQTDTASSPHKQTLLDIRLRKEALPSFRDNDLGFRLVKTDE